MLSLSLLMTAEGCTDHKSSFSPEVFEIAKTKCGATDAYIVEAYPKTIAFHGNSDDHVKQAKCLNEKLSKTDLQQIVVLGSELYEVPYAPKKPSPIVPN